MSKLNNVAKCGKVENRLIFGLQTALVMGMLLATAVTPVGAAVTQLQLQPADTLNSDDQFGSAVAISEDGKTAVVGAPNKEIDGRSNEGAAYIFVRNGTQWIQQARLTGRSVSYTREGFGFAVGISGEAVIVGTKKSKAAYIFARSGTNWTEQTMRYDVVTTWASSSAYGAAVAISGDRAIVGDYMWETPSSTERGAVHFFQRVGDEWITSLYDTLVGSHDYEWYGYSVAVGGTNSLAGGPYELIGKVYSGGAWAYPGGQQLFQDVIQERACFGNSVALSKDGQMGIVGAPYEDENNVGGAVYVFSKTSPSTWSRQARLVIAGGGYHDGFGYSCSLSTGKVVVGAYRQDGLRGAVYVFKGSGANWTEQEPIRASYSRESDCFGYSVGIGGNTVIIGAPAINQSRGGNCYIYMLADNPEPPLINLEMRLGQCQLRFQSVLGRQYRIERSTNLRIGEWSPVAVNITGTGALLEVRETATTEGAAFYRLVMLP